MESSPNADLSRLLSALCGRDLLPQGFAAVVSPAVAVVYPSRVKKLIGLLKAGGVKKVLPVASGIPPFAAACARAIAARGPGIHVLSACPAAIDYLQAHFPRLRPNVLDVPSPMALSAEAALRLGGIPEGSVVAISSCSLKKREEGRVAFDLRVVAAASLLGALAKDGFELDKGPEADFDSGEADVPASACDIADLVGEELRILGIGPALVLKLEGAAKAQDILSELSAGKDNMTDYTVIELSFCENGCVREPDQEALPEPNFPTIL